MKSEISPKLRNFYQELLKWIEIGCPEDLPFSKKHGLCTNLLCFNEGLELEQKTLLKKDCGSCGFPFNKVEEGNRDFALEHLEGQMYTNPKRLAFIKKYAQGAK